MANIVAAHRPQVTAQRPALLQLTRALAFQLFCHLLYMLGQALSLIFLIFHEVRLTLVYKQLAMKLWSQECPKYLWEAKLAFCGWAISSGPLQEASTSSGKSRTPGCHAVLLLGRVWPHTLTWVTHPCGRDKVDSCDSLT